MARTAVHNPFKRLKVGWTWAQHRLHGYAGGTDFKSPIGWHVPAPADAYAVLAHDGLNGVTFKLADGTSVTFREIAVLEGTFPRHVKVGELVGLTGVKWIHADAEVNGKRVRFLPRVNA